MLKIRERVIRVNKIRKKISFSLFFRNIHLKSCKCFEFQEIFSWLHCSVATMILHYLGDAKKSAKKSF